MVNKMKYKEKKISNWMKGRIWMKERKEGD